MIKADLHLHTLHAHGVATTKEIFEAAKKKLSIIGFSEHSPRPAGFTYPQDYQKKLASSFPDYVNEVLEIKMNSQEHEVLLGVEIDFITGQEEYAIELCHAYDYDYCIGGLHFQGTWGFDWSQEAWTALTKQEKFTAYKKYYEDMKRMCETGLFQIAAHPDLIKIFTVETFTEWVETPEALTAIKAALIAMHEYGVAMEVSSAGLRKPCKEIYPCPPIMKLAKEIGLSISFASDAHCTNTPGYAFDRLEKYASSFGYRESVFFRKKEPVVVSFL